MATTISLFELAKQAREEEKARKARKAKKQEAPQPEAKPEQMALVPIIDEKETDNTEPTPEDVAEAIKNLPGIKIELCGRGLWVSGNTKENKDALKAAGLRWASKKKMWYYRQQEFAVHGRSHKSMTYIRAKYGSEELKEA